MFAKLGCGWAYFGEILSIEEDGGFTLVTSQEYRGGAVIPDTIAETLGSRAVDAPFFLCNGVTLADYDIILVCPD